LTGQIGSIIVYIKRRKSLQDEAQIINKFDI
jgi:hypothetical protein